MISGYFTGLVYRLDWHFRKGVDIYGGIKTLHEQDPRGDHDNRMPTTHMSFLFSCLSPSVVAEQRFHAFYQVEGECLSEDYHLAKFCFMSSARSIQV